MVERRDTSLVAQLVPASAVPMGSLMDYYRAESKVGRRVADLVCLMVASMDKLMVVEMVHGLVAKLVVDWVEKMAEWRVHDLDGRTAAERDK